MGLPAVIESLDDLYNKPAAHFRAGPETKNLFSTGDSHEKYERLRAQHGDFGGYFGAGSASGESVTLSRALMLSVVWACITRNASAMGSMPLDVYERKPNGSREKVRGHDLNRLIKAPNADDTGFEFNERASAWLLAQGNAYYEKKKVGRSLVSLETLQADGSTVRPHRDKSGRLVYRVNRASAGSSYDIYEDLPREKVFHIRGFGYHRDLGLSAIRQGVNALGVGLAADKTAGKMFQSGLMASGILKSDQTLDEQQRGQLGDYIEGFMGSNNAFKLMVLEAGLEYQGLNIDPKDAQLLETRRYSVEDICRFFGTPPIIAGHAGAGQTMWGTGVSAIMQAWLTLALNPLACRIEQRMNRYIVPEFTGPKNNDYYVEFNREALLSMDITAKGTFLLGLTGGGLLSRNEARAKLNEPRSEQEGADDLIMNSANQPIDTLGGQDNAQK